MLRLSGWTALAAGGCLALIAGSASANVIVYSNDFENANTSGWSQQRHSVTPIGERGFLGEFGNDTVTLPLSSLPGHDTMHVDFDLYIIRSWDGNNTVPGVGPDVWSLGYMQGLVSQTLLSTTFSAQDSGHNRSQSYPNAFSESEPSNNAMWAGAMEVNTLGYIHSEFSLSAVYHMSFSFPHAGSDAAVWFRGSGLQHLADESWGLDNVIVSVSGVPAPGAIALLGLGGLTIARRRRS